MVAVLLAAALASVVSTGCGKAKEEGQRGRGIGGHHMEPQ